MQLVFTHLRWAVAQWSLLLFTDVASFQPDIRSADFIAIEGEMNIETFEELQIDVNTWEKQTRDRLTVRKTLFDGQLTAESNRIQKAMK